MPRDVPEPIPSKFVVRKLPPELTEEAFKAVLENVCKDELEWFRYHPGSTGESGITTSTAFIKLRHPELAPILKQLLQNSPFIGDHGVPYHCEMEVAFYQRIPKERAKEDPYVATYEKDPYYKDFLKEIEREDEAAKKGPTITATTTIAEESTETEPIITPLMSYVINRYKSASGRSRNGKSSGDGREKENRKKLPPIPEKPPAGKAAPADASTTGKSAPVKRGRGSKKEDKSTKGKASVPDTSNTVQQQEKQQESSQPGKSGRGKGPKDKSRASTNGGTSAGSQPPVPASTAAADGAPVVVSSADVDAARSAAQAAARVAMQLASDTDGPLNAVGASEGSAAKNGSAPSSSKAAPKRPRSGRRARGRAAAGSQEADAAAGDARGSAQAEDTQASEQRLTSASDRAIAAAAAAASAALQDSAPGERPRPRTRPAFGSRGVRDALSRAGIKQPAGPSTGKQGKQKGRGGGSGGGGAAAGALAGDDREGSSGP